MIITAEGQVLLDGYGVRRGAVSSLRRGARDRSTARRAGERDPEAPRPHRGGPGSARRPGPGRVRARCPGVAGAHRAHAGPDSHRVPLALMVPSAPRRLVLMLEAALADDPSVRPTAGELAAGFAAPALRSAPARRPQERMTRKSSVRTAPWCGPAGGSQPAPPTQEGGTSRRRDRVARDRRRTPPARVRSAPVVR
ncbi:hypothetical protein QJS66_05115 [Kocuria rhizophila]|nr:hypothetical protein QJS66_05115 [Kocuria rhizophila]